MIELALQYEWKPLRGADGDSYVFPKEPRAFLPRCTSYPGVYRWRIIPKDPGEKVRVLIGQSSNLRNRLHQYVHPHNENMKRWRQEFLKAIRRGFTIECDLLTFEPFTVRGSCISPMSVEQSQFVRHLVENLMLVISPEDPKVAVLNKVSKGLNENWVSRFGC